MSFLPAGYKAPKSSSDNFMKFQDGENKFRILSTPTIGWEDWDNKKPINYRYDDKPLKSVDKSNPFKHFWALIVWNYAVEKIQVLKITQASVINAIEALSNDSDWGAPFFYDIKVLKKGKDKETKYSITPSPKKSLPAHVKESFYERRCNLEAIFENGDLFSEDQQDYTDGVFSLEDIKQEKQNVISNDQARELGKIIESCDSKYQQQIWTTIRGLNVSNLHELPVNMYENLKKAAMRKKEEYQALMASEQLFSSAGL